MKGRKTLTEVCTCHRFQVNYQWWRWPKANTMLSSCMPCYYGKWDCFLSELVTVPLPDTSTTKHIQTCCHHPCVYFIIEPSNVLFEACWNYMYYIFIWTVKFMFHLFHLHTCARSFTVAILFIDWLEVICLLHCLWLTVQLKIFLVEHWDTSMFIRFM